MDAKRGVSAEYLQSLRKAFAGAGWGSIKKAARRPAAEDGADLVVECPPLRYLVQLKAARDVRRIQLEAFLAGAALEASVHADKIGARPLAVIAAPRLSEGVLHDLREYARKYLGEVAYGFMDSRGHLELHGNGLEGIRSQGRDAREAPRGSWEKAPDLFSDRGQWILKVLLAPRIPANLLSAPREPVANARRLAALAKVSEPVAWRVVRGLQLSGFLEKAREGLRLVRIDELMRQWAARVNVPHLEVRARWLLPPRESEAHLCSRVQEYGRRLDRRAHHWISGPPPRMCLGLFSACLRLALGVVQGAPAYLYSDGEFSSILQELGLVECRPNERADLILRRPRWPESLFRAMVWNDGVAASDVLQCWLDLNAHPARGEEQARHLWERALSDLREDR